MITLIYGANALAARHALQKLMSGYAAEEVERYEGAELPRELLPEIFQGASLFSSKKLVIVRDASGQKALWSDLGEWVQRIPEETHLVLVEEVPDKRTKTFKTLQKHARLIECTPLDEREAVEWIIGRVPEMKRDAAKLLVERVGLDQWLLSNELEKILLQDDVSLQAVRDAVEITPQARVFALLDAVLASRVDEVQQLVADCVGREDPYKFFGLLAGQVFQLAVMSAADGRAPEAVAKDIGAHPYPLKKLQAKARQMSRADISHLVKLVARLDEDMKLSKGEPWLLLERTLIQMAK